ncbi:hypothetical protein GGQ80_003422 [Sphingomonas jinjuensis]|uniref:Uncharacterized protein n=1 Tax=Sphingomonas jinjuensis TaxID=535907 RepID=A0A840FD10_9SPHN|nr:ribonuclease [Sphingomonas jinjuensis]MBB4155499.1 hypothetical protein [Sphingomonas jinjuensis]
MAEWLYEDGIGEARAALVDDGTIVEALIELPGTPRLGTVARGRRTGAATARLDDGTEVELVRAPRTLAEGAATSLRIVREAIPEPGRLKPARAEPTDDAPAALPPLPDRLAATGHAVRRLHPHDADSLEIAGWSELLAEAETGDIGFTGGALRMSPTPAMTLFDVDGRPPLDALSILAARQIAAAIRRHGIGGSIGIDFPTLVGKAPRLAIAEALDAALPQPFERTAVNGFGFLQIVRPRPRASLPELIRADPAAAAARAALRRIERTPPGAPTDHVLSPAVVRQLDSRPDWTAELVRRTGVTHRWTSRP